MSSDSSAQLWSLKVSDNPIIDATTAHVTDHLPISVGRAVGLITKFSGTYNADPSLIIQGSNDKVIWTNPYNIPTDPSTGNITPLILLLTEAFSKTGQDDAINGMNDSAFPYRYFRVKYDPNENTGAATTIEYQLALLRN